MQHPGFFERAAPITLKRIAQHVGAELVETQDADRLISDVRSLKEAGPDHLSFFENRKYLDQLSATSAGACLVSAKLASRVPSTTIALTNKAPYRGFALALQLFYPEAIAPKTAEWEAAAGAHFVHPSATIGERVIIEPGAVVGREARIGSGSKITAGAVIGYRCVVGDNCVIGPGASVTHAILGDRVILHAGVRIGQDGFGFAMSAGGHVKVPQIGRVLIGDDVEIGANSAVDRGALSDTTIGAGTKIDNLVQIGHNVRIGRHCVIVAQSGIAGSAELGDFVVMGGHSGIVGHVKVGAGAQIAGMAHVKDEVPPGAIMGGTPARPFKEWAREVAAVRRLGKRRAGRTDDED